jgi:biopolymer transport protein ExbD
MGAKLGGPGGGSRFTVEQNSDINVTPFVDVMLVLLIIFMVAAPLATVSIKLDLPPAQAPLNAKPEEPTYISIQQSGALYIGSVETGLGTLAGDLARVIAKPNPTEERIFVRADAEVKYFDFMTVMNALQDGGYYQVALVGEDLSGV